MIKYKLRKFKKLNKLRTKKILLWISIMFVFSLSLGSIVKYYASNVNLDIKAKTGISDDGTTVIVNDKEADWNYYESLNYTEIKDKRILPQYVDKYNKDTLVLTQINYNSVDVNDSSLVGYVSSKERQSKYTYYKYYPIIDGEYILVELIDNPWGARPTGYGFNGWVCSNDNINGLCNGIEMSYDSQYYTRYMKVPVSLVDTIDDEKVLIINLDTSWIKADIKSDISQINDYKNKGMVSVSTNEDIVTYMNNSGYKLDGYYYKVSNVDNSGLYYDVNGNRCTSDNTCSGEGYKLIQGSDSSYNTSNGSLDLSNYYYLVTRDTNIFDVLSDGYTLDQFMVESPLTVTSSHDGSNSTLSKVTQVSTTTKSEMVIENVQLTGGNTVAGTGLTGHHIFMGNGVYKSLFAAYNLKVGRNVVSDNTNYYTLDDILGGRNTKTIVESGIYNELIVLPVTGEFGDDGNLGSTNGLHNYAIYGNDYDRATNNNDNLILQYQALSSTTVRHDNTKNDEPTSEMIVKSGLYGRGGIDTSVNNQPLEYGIYVGTIRADTGMNTSALRTLKFEGGKAVNINGGPFVTEGLQDISTAVYMTGGEVENVVGGAGSAESYGSRIVSISGGKVNNAIVGGSNSYVLESLTGPLSADTLVYVGGNTVAGSVSNNESMLTNFRTNQLYAITKKGSVFGAGLGNASDNKYGGVHNSKVIINGGTIYGDVYGGGNYGGVGLTVSNAKTSITISNGTIKGNVYGGSNENGFGMKTGPGNITINMTGGEVGSIYGGSNGKSGKVSVVSTKAVNITLTGGHITGAVYGGGYGINTYVNGDININTNSEIVTKYDTNGNPYQDYSLVIDKDSNEGSIYGGSANGKVNRFDEEIIGTDPSNMQLYYLSPEKLIQSTLSNANNVPLYDSGDIVYVEDYAGKKRFFLALKKADGKHDNGTQRCKFGDGCEVYKPLPFGATMGDGLEPGVTYYYFTDTKGNVMPTIEPIKANQNVTLFEGFSFVSANFENARNKGNVHVNINGGTINGGVFGGGYGELSTAQLETVGNITVDVYDGKIKEVYGGNNLRGAINKSKEDLKVNIYGGTITNVYGGSRGANASVDITNVNIEGGLVTGGVYGGGKQAKTNTSYIKVTAGKTDSDGNILEGVSGSVFGGGYQAAVKETIIDLLNGSVVNNAFGGSNKAGTVDKAVVNNEYGATIKGSVYGGGNEALVIDTQNNLNGATIENAFAGGARADVTNAEMVLYSGNVNNLFGGSDVSGTVGYSDVKLRNGKVNNVFGGNNEGGLAKDGLLDIEPGLTCVQESGYTKYVLDDTDTTGSTVVDCTLNVANIYGGSKGANATSQYTNFRVKGRRDSTDKNLLTIGSYNENNEFVLGSIYGGGLEAPVEEYTRFYLEDIEANDIYGGGVRGPVRGDTNINIIDKVIANNVFGGGFYSFVGNANYNPVTGEYIPGNVNGLPPTEGNTYVNIVNANIKNSVYGSGNASFTYGNTHVNLGDNAINKIQNRIGICEEANPCDSSALEYERGFLESFNKTKENLNININTSVFGGSETNATETTVYDDSFQGVIGTSNVNISAEQYTTSDGINLKIGASIFGGGNNSGVNGKSYVLINKFGTKEQIVKMISVQRATDTYIVDSYLDLIGTKDRAYKTGSSYSLIRIDHLYLLGNKLNESKEGSTLYLNNSTTFLKEYTSGVANINIEDTSISDLSIEEVSQVNISDEISNINVSNVDNEIYVRNNFPPITFNVVNGLTPTIENDTSNAGSVHGMTYFGVYYYDSTNNDKITTNIYDRDIVADTLYGEGAMETYTYVFGKHDADVDAMRENNNGFFTNYYMEESGKISTNYIDPVPKNAAYYRWEIGEMNPYIQVEMEANQYSLRTAVNTAVDLTSVLCTGDESMCSNVSESYWKDAKLEIKDVKTDNFRTEDNSTVGKLVDRSEISAINNNTNGHDGPNNLFALSMGTTMSGWLDNYRTNFYSNDSFAQTQPNHCVGVKNCTGDATYGLDSSTSLRSLSFWLYYSQNLDLSKATKENPDDPDDIPILKMGQVVVKTRIYVYNEEGVEIADYPLDIIISIKLTEGDTDTYGALMSPGKKYEVFQNRGVSISKDGSFSLYQKLSLDLNQYRAGTDIEWQVGDLYNGSIMSTQVNIQGTTVNQFWGPTYRYIDSDYEFPIGTRISMIDLVNNEQYFYDVKQSYYDEHKDNPYYQEGKYKYFLTDFVKMGCTNLYDSNGRIDENFFSDDMIPMNRVEKDGKVTYEPDLSRDYKYYNKDVNFATEEFIFIVDYSGVDSKITSRAESEKHHVYMKLARQVSEELNEDGSLKNPVESTIVIPRGQPERDLVYELYPKIDSIIESTGEFYDEITKTSKDKLEAYDDADNVTVKLDTHLSQSLEGAGSEGIVDTQFEDYRVGATIMVQRLTKNDDGTTKYENVTDKLNGLVISTRDDKFYPYTDGTIRIPIAGRISEVSSLIRFDFSNSDLRFGQYRFLIETFVSYDGLYYGIKSDKPIELYFELLDSDYGLEVTTNPVSINHDVNTGRDQNESNDIVYTIKTKNGLKNPNLRIGLQRRNYDGEYSTEYTEMDLKDLFETVRLEDSEGNIISGDILNSCDIGYITNPDGSIQAPTGEEVITSPCRYRLGDIEQSKRTDATGNAEDITKEYKLYATLKNGPTDEDKENPAQAKWKTGTYRIVIYMYDDVINGETLVKSNYIGEAYEYLIIRKLDIGEGSES